MAAGKNKVERGFLIIIDNSAGAPKDLTGDLVPGTFSGGGLVFDEADMTGVSESTYNFLAGHASSDISAQFYLNDTATTGAHTVLIGNAGGTGTLTARWGAAGVAATGGDPEWEGEYVILSANVVLAGNKWVIQANFKPTGSTAPAWGTV